MQEKTKEWFSEWFDSPFYHILYKHRDEKEAGIFIDNLCLYLQILPEDKLLDLACGKGRHAIYFNKKGFNVTGTDLSEKSIQYARQFENNKLKFMMMDMREMSFKNEFNYIFNLFTSFGYFKYEEENYQTLKNLYNALKKKGKLVIDFMNTSKVLKELVTEEEKNIENINFHITRRLEGKFIVKDIKFNHEAISHHYSEKVMALTREDFLQYLDMAGFTVTNIFGDYYLNAFDQEKSDRMIFIAEKN